MNKILIGLIILFLAFLTQINLFEVILALTAINNDNLGTQNDVALMRSLYPDPSDRNDDYLTPYLLPWWQRIIINMDPIKKLAVFFVDRKTSGFINHMNARTKYLDSFFNQTDFPYQQVVITASGLDTRAYRFANQLKNVIFFELDLPDAVKRKEKSIIEVEKKYGNNLAEYNYNVSRKNVVYVAIDLNDRNIIEKLVDTKKFDVKKPTLFIMEGILYYLPSATVDSVFRDIAKKLDRVCIAHDQHDRCIYHNNCSNPLANEQAIYPMGVVEKKGYPWISGLVCESKWLKEYFAQMGLKINHMVSSHELNEKYLKNEARKKIGML